VLRPDIEAYLQRWVPDRDTILHEMEQRAEAKHFPIVGPVVGRLLAQLTLLVSAQQILELGAGFGYSAYWFARALPTNGRVLAVERSAENARLGQEYLERGGLTPKVNLGDPGP
jgi:predicted O-methyltransferase YrrM